MIDTDPRPDDADRIPEGHRRRRRRTPLNEVGRTPDYRFTLANERTFLAWVRTALALVAGGIAVVQLVPPFSLFDGARQLLGTTLVTLAIAISVTSHRRWERNERALRLGEALPPSRLPWIVGAGVAVVATVALVLVAFSHSGPR